MENPNLKDEFLNVFTTNKYVYETSQSIETLKSKIEFVINQKQILNFKYNLTGNLNSDNSFKLTRRAGLGVIKSWDRDPVTIRGKLIQSQTNLTKVEMDLKPNFIFVLFPILFGVIGIGALLNSIFNQDKETLIGGFFLMVIPIMWIMAKYTKNYYKSEFERALNLPKNEIILNRTIKL